MFCSHSGEARLKGDEAPRYASCIKPNKFVFCSSHLNIHRFRCLGLVTHCAHRLPAQKHLTQSCTPQPSKQQSCPETSWQTFSPQAWRIIHTGIIRKCKTVTLQHLHQDNWDSHLGQASGMHSLQARTPCQ